MGVAIRVENLSKAYQLGQFSTGTLSKDLERWWALFRGKEDPYLKIGEVNDRSVKGTTDVVWSLKDINFDVKQGEAFGIIGKNGAGKSTLLKLLSQITNPTTGSVKVRGRVASLLEVGTGFHPELTGKENIFLNGAILGMTKREIKSKYDEIVDFSGVERYIETPVKRYSSGMYVRLAFAVAAHLEPEILIVDEVLAVGDAEFQKKCIGKMKDVSGEGRTVLFVSHNMTAMNSICDTAMYLKNGQLVEIGAVTEIINSYLSQDLQSSTKRVWELENAPGDDSVKLLKARLLDRNGNEIDAIDFYDGGTIEITYILLQDGLCPIPNIHLFDRRGEYILVSSESYSNTLSEKGTHIAKVDLPAHFLNDGQYILGIAATTTEPSCVHFFEKEALAFSVVEDMNYRTNNFRGTFPGSIRPNLHWKTEKAH